MMTHAKQPMCSRGFSCMGCSVANDLVYMVKLRPLSLILITSIKQTFTLQTFFSFRPRLVGKSTQLAETFTLFDNKLF